MEDREIVELYWQRSENAIRETEGKYGHGLLKLAYNVLLDLEDSRESVNDTYLSAWNSMPPQKPTGLFGYLGKITRQLSIDRLRRKTALKRGGGEYPLSLEELGDCVSGYGNPQTELELQQLGDAISRWLRTLPQETRRVFIRRYFYLDSIEVIAKSRKDSPGKVKSMLYRCRISLRAALEKEGYRV